MATTRGNIDTIDQTQVRQLSGGSFSTQLMTTDASSKTPGNFLTVDSHGIVTDTGVNATSVANSAVPKTPVLNSTTGQPILNDLGEWIFPG